MSAKKKRAIICASGVIIIALILICIIYIKSDSSESSLIFTNFRNAAHKASESVGSSYQNLILPQTIQIPEPTALYTLTVTTKDNIDCKEKLNLLCERMCGQKATSVSEAVLGNGAQGVCDNKGMLSFFYGGSFLWAAMDPDKMWAEYSTDTVEAVYDLEKDDLTGINYDVSGSPYPASKAVEYAKEQFNEKIKEFMLMDTETKPKELIVFNSKDEGHYYCITFEHYVDGVPLLWSGTGLALKTRIFPSQLEIHIHHPDEITVIKNGYYRVLSEKKEIQEIITLESALKKLEKELAPYGVYTVSDIRLEYVAADTVLFGSDTLEYRPSWCFIIEDQSRNTSYISPKKLLLCDALTGEISCWDDKKGDYVFGAPKPTGVADDPDMLNDTGTVESLKREYGLSDEEFNALIQK